MAGADDAGTVPRLRPVAGISRANVGEDDFPAFYRAHLTTIYRFLRARTPTPQDAEDLVQQVFVKAYQARSGFRGDEAARLAWLFRIARNETSSWYRRGGRDTVPIDASPASVPQLLDPDPGPESWAVMAERDLALARLVGRLPEADQELIQLRFAAGLTSVQIATVLGVSPGAARQRLHRALERLREWSDDDLR